MLRGKPDPQNEARNDTVCSPVTRNRKRFESKKAEGLNFTPMKVEGNYDSL